MTAGQKNIISIIASTLLAAVLVFGLDVNLFAWIDRVTAPSAEESMSTTTEITATATRVLDGDTFAIASEKTPPPSVRLIGIDAPEIDWAVSSQPEDECFGFEARDLLKELIEGREVRLVGDQHQPAYDTYDRLLAYVYVDGELVNEKLLAAGMARELTIGSGYQMQANFQNTAAQAKALPVGLWAECVE